VTPEIIVFLGPTLSKAEASAHLNARFCPPAEQGSVFEAVHGLNAGAIVLIDGIFATVPAVRHKEILWALSRGVPVFGAGSMGALRAAELAAFGMKGHGLVYRWYLATPLADDDEVAVAMSPAEIGAQPLSEALINMRLTFRRAARQGIIPPEVRLRLEEVARSTHFLERSYPEICKRACAVLPSQQHFHIDALSRWVTDHAIDQKKADAVGLLRRLARFAPARASQLFPFRMTEAWAADLEAAGLLKEFPLPTSL
jgi:hypothetical protein